MSTPAYQSMNDYYRDPTLPYAGFPQEHRSGGSLPIDLLRAQQNAFEATDPAVPAVLLSCALKAEMPFRWNVGDGWTDRHWHRGGEIALFPAMTEVDLDCGGDHDLLVLSFPSQSLEETLDAHRVGSLSVFDPLTGATLFQDTDIRRTMMQLWTESARAGGTSDLLIDGLVQVLIARLLDKAGALTRTAPIARLSYAELARLDAFIDDHLPERITVELLANTIDLPRWSFAEAFKATTGETPHAYVTTRRITRACEFLRLGLMPLAEIAYAVGFASQSHMTDTFRQQLGTTPGAWRKEVRE